MFRVPSIAAGLKKGAARIGGGEWFFQNASFLLREFPKILSEKC